MDGRMETRHVLNWRKNEGFVKGQRLCGGGRPIAVPCMANIAVFPGVENGRVRPSQHGRASGMQSILCLPFVLQFPFDACALNISELLCHK